MEIEYKRELEKSYMIIRREKKDWEDFEVQMFLNNRIEGMLPFFFVIEDGRIEFVYDITGKQSFDIYIRRKGLKENIYYGLLRSLKKIHHSVEDYLLNENALVLTEEMIFVDHNGGGFSYCYLPGYVQPVNESFQSLLEALMAKVMPEESCLLEEIHKVHQNILAGNFSLSSCGPADSGMFEEENHGEAVRYAETDVEGCLPEESEAPLPAFRIKEKFMQSFKSFSKISDSRGNGEGHNKKGFLEKKIFLEGKEHKIKSIFKEKKNEDPIYGDYQISYHPDAGMVEEEYIHPTVYIGGGQTALSGKFESKDTSLNQDFEISEGEIIIGKNPEEADICLNGDTVSRVHAAIRKVDHNFFIEDLNSTNGTFINSMQIPYRETVMLHYGDEVVFGTAKFIFY